MSAANNRTFAQWARRYLMNFSLIAIVGMLAYILFFTDTSIQQTYIYEHQAEQLSHEIRVETDSLEYYRNLNRRLASDPHTLEKPAREQYPMQRPHEDVFVIE